VSFLNERARSTALARTIASWVQRPGLSHCLLWYTEWGIWPSSENLHLYYRLRSSYGDLRELHEAPGHLFLGHEIADLTTFVDLAIRFGWGGWLLPCPTHTRIFISHDEWILVETEDRIATVLADAERLALPVSQAESSAKH
jgi:hypothetical protein